MTVPSGELVPCLGLRKGHPCRHKHGRVPRGRQIIVRTVPNDYQELPSPAPDLVVLCGGCKTYHALTVLRPGQAA